MQYTLGDFVTTIDFVSPDKAMPVEAEIALFDEHTRALFPKYQGPSLVIPPGEEHKDISRVLDFAQKGLDSGLARDSVFVGAGGGVVCDMAAFTAAIYMRGAQLVLIPTSLLAMVDASVGGKSGVDFSGGKNLIGSFYPAMNIRIAVGLLDTLPEHEFLNGMAEVIKHALLHDEELLALVRDKKELILQRDPNLLEDMIRRAIAVKGWYIEQDFKEQSIRAHLNFGHTFGHALESCGGLSQWSHGESVAWGMMRSLEAGALLGITDREYVKMVRNLLLSYGYPIDYSIGDMEQYLSYIMKDKKKQRGEVQFVLQRGFADTLKMPLSSDLIAKVVGGHYE